MPLLLPEVGGVYEEGMEYGEGGEYGAPFPE